MSRAFNGLEVRPPIGARTEVHATDAWSEVDATDVWTEVHATRRRTVDGLLDDLDRLRDDDDRDYAEGVDHVMAGQDLFDGETLLTEFADG
jgi:hypothetical protein